MKWSFALGSMSAAFVALGMLGCESASRGRAGSSREAQRAESPQASGPHNAADPGFLDDFAQTFRFRLGLPQQIKFTPDGRTILFVRSEGPRSFVQNLYEHDIATGRERVLLTAEQILRGENETLSAEEIARRERARLASRGIAGFELSRDGSKVLVPLSGRLFVYDRASAIKTELPSQAGFPIDPRFSPDASKIAAVREGDLYVTDVATGAETRLTTRENPSIEHGAAEFVAQEEMDRREGYWWSPDSRWLAYQRTDTSSVEQFRIADPVNPEKPPQEWPYPRAGRNNAQVTLGVIPAQGGTTTWVNWDRAAYPYLARVDWSKDAPLTILVQNRVQTEQLLLEVDPASGATRELLRERDNAWINLHSAPKWLDDGSAFVWHTDASVDERLELRARDGSLTTVLTPPWLLVRDLVAIDSERRVAYVTACEHPERVAAGAGAGPEMHAWRVSLEGVATGNEPIKLSPEGVNALAVAPKSAAWVITNERADAPARFLVHDQATRRPEVRSIAERPSVRPSVEFTVEEGPSGATHPVAIFRPRSFRAGFSYPVILSVYTGPGLQYVTANPRGGLLDQWYADHGFIVVRIDNRGTPGRGRAWERAIKHNLIDIPLDDQAGVLKNLARRYAEIDAERVGVYGWSFGGYFSAMAAMQRPDIFKAGVAGAPVCDWADYDTHYTERFMGLPHENPRGYQASNVLTHCKDLEVPLLVIHGTADDNVYFLHSLKMTDALFRAGKHFEFLVLPGFTHMVPDPVVTRSLYSRIAAFFQTHLGEPRATELSVSR